MKQFIHIKNFVVGFALSFLIGVISSFIAAIFSGYPQESIFNLCDKIVGPFFLLFPIYYVYKKSKDNVNPNSKLSNTYIFTASILALSTLMVICIYTSDTSITTHTEEVKLGNKISHNNSNKYLELPENDLPDGYFEEKHICGFKVIFPCKTREKQIDSNGLKYTSYQSVPTKGIPYLRAECLPITVNKSMNTEKFIRTTLKNYAEESNVEIREITYEKSKIGEIGKVIATIKREKMEATWVAQLIVGNKSVLSQVAVEQKTRFPSSKMVTFLNAVSLSNQ